MRELLELDKVQITNGAKTQTVVLAPEFTEQQWEKSHVNREQCIKDIQAVAHILGHQPTKRQYRKLRKEGSQGIESLKLHFGCWATLMKAAGFDPKLAVAMPPELTVVFEPENSTAPASLDDWPKTEPASEAPKASEASEAIELKTEPVSEVSETPEAVEPKTEPKPELLEPETEPASETSKASGALGFKIEPAPEAESEALEASEPIAFDPLAELPSYRLVNLLTHGFYVNSPGGRFNAAKDFSISVVEQETTSIDEKGNLNHVRTRELVLEKSGQKFDLPEPQEGVFYLIDKRLFSYIKDDCDRKDFIPAFLNIISGIYGLNVGEVLH